MLTSHIDDVTEPQWNDLLSHFADANIYQTWAYGAVSWGENQISHIVLRSDGEFIAAAQVRIVRIPLLDRGVAHVRWGPLCLRRGIQVNSYVFESIIGALVEEYAKRRGLMLRIVPSHFVGDHTGSLFKSALTSCGFSKSKSRSPYHTIALNLAQGPEALRKAFDGKWRNKLSGAERNELTVIEGDNDVLYERFVSAYEEMLNRKRFDTTVDPRVFGRIQKRLPQSLKMKVFIAEKSGETLNALVLAGIGDTAIYLLGATTDEGTKMKGAYLLQWRAIQWLCKNGFSRYDLGGVNPYTNPGVYEFKRGFSGKDAEQLGQFEMSFSGISSVAVRTGERFAALFRAIRRRQSGV